MGGDGEWCIAEPCCNSSGSLPLETRHSCSRSSSRLHYLLVYVYMYKCLKSVAFFYFFSNLVLLYL